MANDTTDRPRMPLPSFGRPPVVEVVCGVQFAPIVGWLTSHYGLLWSEIRAQYPVTEDHPPVAKLKLGELEGTDELNAYVLPPLRRVFFVHSSQAYLMQVQQNRFLHNWRKVTEHDEYPRFHAAYGQFTEQWTLFRTFLKSHDLPEPRVEGYELTYVNLMTAPEAKFPQDIWRFLSFYNRFPLAASGAEPRAMNLQVGWPLGTEDGKLAFSVKHGRRLPDSSEDLLIAEFSATGRANRDASNMQSWFTVAHDAIVGTFAELTTEEAHRGWERIE